MNNKGFMMAEVIVVSAIILVAMGGLYASYNKIFSLYNQRVDYYDVATLYELANIKDNYVSTNYTTVQYPTYSNNKGEKKTVYYIKNNGISDDEREEEVNDIDIIYLSKSNSISPTFKDYLKYLSTSLEVKTEKFFVMERCITPDNCKYAYLEGFE